MTTWTRAAVVRRCGRCSDEIEVGEPMLEIATGAGRALVRCHRCADTPVPTDLPALPVRPPTTPPRGQSTLPLREPMPETMRADWKRASAGEREPGEDDGD